MPYHRHVVSSDYAVVGLVFGITLATPHAGLAQANANRIVVDLVADGNSDLQSVLLINSSEHDLMAYRFRVDGPWPGAADGDPADTPGNLIVLVDGDPMSRALRLSSGSRDVTFPRPLGVRIRAGDSIRVAISFPEGQTREVAMRLSIDHDPVDRPASRIAVVAVAARSSVRTSSATTWEWTEESDGRLLAVSGVPVQHVRLVSLIDLESGATLWSSTRGGDNARAPGAAGAVLRLGVPLVAGRTYRLTATYADGAVESPVGHGVVAMVLPVDDPR
ncbi:MAG TPA: hypothetical protein VFG84_12105 [Gemmatimonadaceae bacterium]|nr:hypothetical protein [Gemmatimonadaceae bacterium]